MNPKQWRIDNKLSQAELAARIGVTAVTISRVESGQRHPEPSTIQSYQDLSSGMVSANDFQALYQQQKANIAPGSPAGHPAKAGKLQREAVQ